MTINKKTDDLKISSMKELVSPIDIINEIPMTEKATETVVESRRQIIDIINKKDNAFLVRCSLEKRGEITFYFNSKNFNLYGWDLISLNKKIIDY